MSQEQPQSQTQSQTLNLALSFDNSGDPQFEQHVFNDLYSVGRQLGRVSSVLEIVLSALDGSPALQLPEAWQTIEAFHSMQLTIAKAKEERRPEQAIINELSELSKTDPDEHARVVAALNTYLCAANVQR